MDDINWIDCRKNFRMATIPITLIVVFSCNLLDTAWSATKVPIDALRIQISDRSWADSSGKLRFDIRQGDTYCSTIRETFVKPRKNTEYEESRSSHKFGSCYSALFDPNDAIEFRIISDSGDDAYIDSAAVKLGGVWREWSGYQVKVNKHGAGNSWRYVPKQGEINSVK